MSNMPIKDTTSLSDKDFNKIKYIPSNIVNYIAISRAKQLDEYIEAVCVRYGLDYEKFGTYLSGLFTKMKLDNIEKKYNYLVAVVNKEAINNKDDFRKEYKILIFNKLYRAFEKVGIEGSTADKLELEFIENHLLNEFLNEDEIKQMNNNIVDYMSERGEYEISTFINYVKRSRYVNNHANVPYSVFRLEAERIAFEWDKMVEEEESE